VWSPNFRNVTARQVSEAHGLGLAVIPWTVNDMDDLTLVIQTGVDGVITDYPDRGRAALPKTVTPPRPVPVR
jgi:glycerophosphoryl diester phosphodiesterase